MNTKTKKKITSFILAIVMMFATICATAPYSIAKGNENPFKDTKVTCTTNGYQIKWSKIKGAKKYKIQRWYCKYKDASYGWNRAKDLTVSSNSLKRPFMAYPICKYKIIAYNKAGKKLAGSPEIKIKAACPNIQVKRAYHTYAENCGMYVVGGLPYRKGRSTPSGKNIYCKVTLYDNRKGWYKRGTKNVRVKVSKDGSMKFEAYFNISQPRYKKYPVKMKYKAVVQPYLKFGNDNSQKIFEKSSQSNTFTIN